ncbi:MAG: LapA family protein [Gammaproteobacteria bacterium]|nr:LapA family protein [Gammaproteobacteria bacterium]
MRRIILLLFALVVFGIVLALVLQNLQPIRFNYLFATVPLPLAAVLGGALVVGAVVGALTALPAVFRARRRMRRCRGRLSQAQKEIDNLRRAPIRDAH